MTIKQNPAVSRSLDRRPKERGTRLCSEARLALGYHCACLSSMNFARASSFRSLVPFFSLLFLRTACDSRQSLTTFVGSTDVTLGLSDKRVRHNPSPQDKTFDSSRDARLLMLVLPVEGTVIIRCSRWTSGLRSIITNRRTLTYTRHYYT